MRSMRGKYKLTEFGFDYSGLKAYAGHLLEKDRLLKSSSGGAASHIAEQFIKKGGVVLGVGYADDFKSAEYYCVTTVDGLEKLKGSKYIPARKMIHVDGEYRSVYKVAEEYLADGKSVLYIGLGCDVGALRRYCEVNTVRDENLFTIELICVGTTLQEAHSMYIQETEARYHANIRKLNVRYKKEGWLPYIRIEFDDQRVFEAPFNESDLGIAFNILCRKSCSQCAYKGSSHVGDIAVGDYFRLGHDDDIYDENGVSILIEKTEKGRQLIESIAPDEFLLKEMDIRKALLENHRYYECSVDDIETGPILENLRTNGLRYAIEKYYAHLIPDSVKHGTKKKVVMWGTGNFFRRYYPLVDLLCDVNTVCDNNEANWGKVFQENILCISPEELCSKENVFVVIMIENRQAREMVEKQLETLGIYSFDYVLNWIKYASREMFD